MAMAVAGIGGRRPPLPPRTPRLLRARAAWCWFR
jgi:hypothetical protein